MSSPVTEILLQMRADGDQDAFVGWCLATQDPIAFRGALRRVEDSEWRGIYACLAESLGGRELDPPGSSSGYAAVRDRRSRAVARSLKLEVLEQLHASRRVRIL